jgi:hypothetical protein
MYQSINGYTLSSIKLWKYYCTTLRYVRAISLGQKMVMEQIWAWQPRAKEISQHSPKGPSFSFSLGERVGFFGFLLFPLTSQQCSPSSQIWSLTCSQLHLNCPQFYSCDIYIYKCFTPTFALSSTLVTYIKSPRGADYNMSVFRTTQSLIYFLGLISQSMMPITKGKKKKNWTLRVPTTNW